MKGGTAGAKVWNPGQQAMRPIVELNISSLLSPDRTDRIMLKNKDGFISGIIYKTSGKIIKSGEVSYLPDKFNRVGVLKSK